MLKDQGRLDEAVSCCRQAIARDPKLAGAYYNLGLALNAQDKLDEAIAAYREAIALAPAYAEAHTNLGVALRKHGDLDEAIAAHREAIALKPDYAEAHSNLGVALRHHGDLDEAITPKRISTSADHCGRRTRSRMRLSRITVRSPWIRATPMPCSAAPCFISCVATLLRVGATTGRARASGTLMASLTGIR